MNETERMNGANGATDRPASRSYQGKRRVSPAPTDGSASRPYEWKRPLGKFLPNPKLKFLEQCREAMRFKHLARRTEETYLQWIHRFIVFHRQPAPGGKWIWRHPKEMGEAEVRGFLTDLAVQRQVSAATQNQALNALLFMYREAIGEEMAWVDGFEQAHRSLRIPVVLTREEVLGLLERLAGVQRLIGQILYGSGLRLLECLRLRIKDLDIARRQVIVRGGKGDKDRVTMLAECLQKPLRAHPAQVSRDLAAGCEGRVWPGVAAVGVATEVPEG